MLLKARDRLNTLSDPPITFTGLGRAQRRTRNSTFVLDFQFDQTWEKMYNEGNRTTMVVGSGLINQSVCGIVI